MDSWWRRRRFFNNFFGNFEDEIWEEFRRMEEHMARFFDEATREIDPSRNFVYGVNIRFTPEGKAQITEFGDLPRDSIGEERGREPLVDVLDGEDEIKVIAEIPGVEKEDIELSADNKHLVINVDTEKRKYHKELELPAEIKQDEIKATYKNGILEVTMKRVEKKKEGKRKRIKIE